MNKIIIVAQYFYPYKGVASQRINYFAKFFLHKGIDFEVIAQIPEQYTNLTEENDFELKNVPAKRVKLFKHKIFIVFNALKWLFIIKKMHQKNPNAIFFVTGGPFLYFLVLPFIYNKRNPIKYVLDYRDAIPLKPDLAKSYNGYIKKILLNLHSHSIRKAALILNVSEELTQVYRDYYCNLSEDKFYTVMNGYNEEIKPNENYNLQLDQKKINLAIIGKFDYYNNDDTLKLIEYIRKSDFEICIYQAGEFCKVLKESIGTNYHFLGQIEYSEALKVINDCDACILNYRDRYSGGTKIFDYIKIRKPIIAFIENDFYIDKILKVYPGYFRIDSYKNFEESVKKIKYGNINVLFNNNDEGLQFSRKIQAEKLLTKLYEL